MPGLLLCLLPAAEVRKTAVTAVPGGGGGKMLCGCKWFKGVEYIFLALLCCQLKPLQSLDKVLRNTFAIDVHGTKAVLCYCTPLLGRKSVALGCLFVVLFHTYTFAVHETKVVLRHMSVAPWRSVVHQLPKPLGIFLVRHMDWCMEYSWQVGHLRIAPTFALQPTTLPLPPADDRHCHHHLLRPPSSLLSTSYAHQVSCSTRRP